MQSRQHALLRQISGSLGPAEATGLNVLGRPGLTRRNTLTSTYPAEPTPPPAGASRPDSAEHANFNISRRTYATARRGVPAVPAFGFLARNSEERKSGVRRNNWIRQGRHEKFEATFGGPKVFVNCLV